MISFKQFIILTIFLLLVTILSYSYIVLIRFIESLFNQLAIFEKQIIFNVMNSL